MIATQMQLAEPSAPTIVNPVSLEATAEPSAPTIGDLRVSLLCSLPHSSLPLRTVAWSDLLMHVEFFLQWRRATY